LPVNRLFFQTKFLLPLLQTRLFIYFIELEKLFCAEAQSFYIFMKYLYSNINIQKPFPNFPVSAFTILFQPLFFFQ